MGRLSPSGVPSNMILSEQFKKACQALATGHGNSCSDAGDERNLGDDQLHPRIHYPRYRPRPPEKEQKKNLVPARPSPVWHLLRPVAKYGYTRTPSITLTLATVGTILVSLKPAAS